MEEPLFVSPARASELTGLCPATIYNRMNDGSLRSRKSGRRRLVEFASLRELGNGASDNASCREMLIHCVGVLSDYLNAVHPASVRAMSQKARTAVQDVQRYLDKTQG